MKYEVIETGAEWVVMGEGIELARFADQAAALDYVAECLRSAEPSEDAVSLRVRYLARG